ncbi:mitochondrial potassium channel [Synchiropus splendidus]|uniref:mitochondrial potassium channel n=1 Tax=Synchiropus splendidus TaxID=270530 RepID=UPI00237ED6B0|nr:mitochondrial potassium channel [Synchiropus splendidus]
MRYSGVQLSLWTHGFCCRSGPLALGCPAGRVVLLRPFSAHHEPSPPPPAGRAPPEQKSGAELMKERVMVGLQHAGELGRQWGQKSLQLAMASVNRWWARYEEFVGLNEVRDAQSKVTEAEAAFMVARGMVREAHLSLEALQVRLKEVRDRLDRVSREEAHYLELATLEHKLLQEERRLRTAYENSEESEREKFALFSAGVRESHEKERTRAERTKNWSIIGSVLGALIGVMGSTYINRVRLQELKSLLLEAQKGPESLQEALRVQAGNHRSQQDELRTIIDSLRVTLHERVVATPDSAPTTGSPMLPVSVLKELSSGSKRAESLLGSLMPQVGQLEQGLGRVESELLQVRKFLETPPKSEWHSRTAERPESRDQWKSEMVLQRLDQTQKFLGEGIQQNTILNAIVTSTAAAVTISAVYLLLRGPG